MSREPASDLELEVADLVDSVRTHDLYRHVRDERSLRLLMRSHVFAVFDFQSLLKALQRGVTCLDVPWLPTADPEMRRFVNEIVVDEESDLCPWGGHLSHFELYHRAMVECGADTRPIDAFVAGLRAGSGVDAALAACRASAGVRHFVRTTMEIAESRSIHRIAAAFSLGREDIIPQMFQRLVESLAAGRSGNWSTFRYYLARHVSNDAEKHGPMARTLVTRLCVGDATRNAESIAAARRCLEARIRLWDEVLGEIRDTAALTAQA